MSKFIVLAFVVLCGTAALAQRVNDLKSASEDVAAPAVKNEFKCEGPTVAPDHWTDMNQTCTDAVRDQIQMEVDASYVYLAMGAYFARDDVNMPGFSKMFFEHASEERSHALALIEYLLMRGPGKKDQKLTEKLVSVSAPAITTWANGLAALNAALDKEKEVTESIRNVIGICERNGDDYHISDHLTGEFLEEQYRGMRELAGKISTLGKMMKNSGALGSFLFDKELLA